MALFVIYSYARFRADQKFVSPDISLYPLKKGSLLFTAGFQSIFHSDYAGEIASTGQTSAQDPQSVQSSLSIL
jgi:hypothetical protein